MKFTVFGATGFIGSGLTKHLQNCGHTVLVPKRSEEIDFSTDLGHVIYAIGLTGDFRKRPFETIDAHVSNLIKIIKNAKYDSWLYLSSTRFYLSSENTSELDRICVIPSLDSVYDISKLLGESLCLSLNNSKIRIARLSNVYGKGQSTHTFLGSLFSDIKSVPALEICEDPNSSKDYVALTDVIELLILISTQGTDQIYNVASGMQIKHSEIVNKLQNLIEQPIKFKEGAPIRKFPTINIDRIRNEFGFKPRNLLDDLVELIR